jgi:peptidoglycan/xylan/chitin deacetylase (PgdA/CDA1 family)
VRPKDPVSELFLTIWPADAPFGLFLSHDVDQVYDRGFYRTVGDLHHLQRVLTGREAGDAKLCSLRIGRSLFRPNGWRRQFERILDIESAYGWKSTYFFLEGNRWSRYGARYRLEDEQVRALAGMLIEAGCEIGVHGGYHDLNSAAGYRRSAERIEAAFGVRPIGIRNHYLRFTGLATWKAQALAGFHYDATFGWNDQLGPRDGRWSPFRPRAFVGTEFDYFIVLPIMVMDVTLFHHLGLTGNEALRRIDETYDRAVEAGGLVSLLWHNNYFAEPEYAEWEEVYAEALRRAAAYGPYCATGAKVARWCLAEGSTLDV